MTDVTIRLRAGTFRINGKPWMDLHNEAADRIEELQAEVARLRLALEHSKTGWENVVELELLDPAYDFTASELLYEARAALEYKD
mgnify:CR=1 FL=1|tara:strand:- start:195 stop:449 length:255 start_codon:yes stop_codon:yes gene_type:complete